MVLPPVVVVLLLLSDVLPVVTAKRQKPRRKRTNSKQEMQARRMTCEMECLTQWVPEEAMNCIHTCRSPACFAQLYGEDPLEPGQVDTERAEVFDRCNMNEILEEKKKEREARKQQMNNLQDVGEENVREEIGEETQEVS